MFIRMETNKRAEDILSWLGSHKQQETQITLAKRFGKSRTFLSLALNKKMVSQGAETLVNDVYEYLQNKYGL